MRLNELLIISNVFKNGSYKFGMWEKIKCSRYNIIKITFSGKTSSKIEIIFKAGRLEIKILFYWPLVSSKCIFYIVIPVVDELANWQNNSLSIKYEQ